MPIDVAITYLVWIWLTHFITGMITALAYKKLVLSKTFFRIDPNTIFTIDKVASVIYIVSCIIGSLVGAHILTVYGGVASGTGDIPIKLFNGLFMYWAVIILINALVMNISNEMNNILSLMGRNKKDKSLASQTVVCNALSLLTFLSGISVVFIRAIGSDPDLNQFLTLFTALIVTSAMHYGNGVITKKIRDKAESEMSPIKQRRRRRNKNKKKRKERKHYI